MKDRSTQVCQAQAIPTDGSEDVSAKSMDLQAAAPGAIGSGATIRVEIVVTTALDTASTDTILVVNAITDSDSELGSHATIGPIGEITITTDALAAGTRFVFNFPQKPQVAFERYVGISMEPASSDLSAGAIDAWILPN